MRTLRLSCWLRVLERKAEPKDDNLHFACHGCAQPLVLLRDAPLAVA